MKIEDYGFLSDTQTAALVGRNGSVDWLCFPRFDSDSCFAALLGKPKNGRWLIAPKDESAAVTRKYRGHTLILETTFDTRGGAVRLIDFMPPRGANPDIVRIVEGVRGKVTSRRGAGRRDAVPGGGQAARAAAAGHLEHAHH